MSDLFDESRRATLERRIDEWLATVHHQHPNAVAAVKSPDDDRRWMVRLRGETKEFTTIWMTLGQRTLRYETYVMPAPEENAEMLWENLLRRNEKIVGAHFSIGVEDAVFLRGEIPLSAVTEREVDRVIGTLFSTVETVFPSIIRIGFASRFAQ